MTEEDRETSDDGPTLTISCLIGIDSIVSGISSVTAIRLETRLDAFLRVKTTSTLFSANIVLDSMALEQESRPNTASDLLNDNMLRTRITSSSDDSKTNMGSPMIQLMSANKVEPVTTFEPLGVSILHHGG